MTISMEDAARRIVISKAEDVEEHLKHSNIGLTVITGRSLDDINYGTVPTLVVHLPENGPDAADDEFEEFSDFIQQDINRIIEFLETNPTRNILIHCSAGMHRSPNYALFLLLNLQGEKRDFFAAMAAVHKIRPLADLSEIFYYRPYLGLSQKKCEKLIVDYSLAKRIRNRINDGDNFQDAFNNVARLLRPRPTLKHAKKVFRKIGFEYPKDTAPCDAGNDQPTHTPSSPHKPASRAGQHMGRGGPS
ncbi:MAG: hypothetical protein AAF549_03545 [Pseudomonadota bacterium]